MGMKEKLQDWKKQAEELRLQAHLGKMEAEDAFEERKKELKNWVEDRRSDIDRMESSGSERLTEMRQDLEELRLQLALGKAEGRDAILAQQKNIQDKLRKLNENISSYSRTAKENTKDWAEKSSDKLEQFRMKFDLFRLQFHLGVKEGNDIWDEKKEDLSKAVSKFRARVDQLENKTGDKWDNFKSEISEAWDHFKKAF